MRIKEKGRKAKGQNGQISTLVSLFLNLLGLEFSMGRASGRLKMGGKSLVS